jgi:hypothetical protein
VLVDGPHDGSSGCLVLGHGAGGGVGAPDLLAARDAGLETGLRVVRVEQPWRVSGRRVAEAPARLDLAWRAVVEWLRPEVAAGPLVVGGRSAGARVACRTADACRADAVLALAFPLLPPRRPAAVSREHELLAPRAPRLVLQGARDAFGVPAPGPGVQVHVVRGADHAFAVRRADGRDAASVGQEVRAVVGRWLAEVVRASAPPEGQTLT